MYWLSSATEEPSSADSVALAMWQPCVCIMEYLQIWQTALVITEQQSYLDNWLRLVDVTTQNDNRCFRNLLHLAFLIARRIFCYLLLPVLDNIICNANVTLGVQIPGKHAECTRKEYTTFWSEMFHALCNPLSYTFIKLVLKI